MFKEEPPTSTTHFTIELSQSIEYLQAVLYRLDLLIRRQIWRWQLAGQDLTDEFRGLHLSEQEAEALLARPFGGNWGATVTLPPAEEQAFAQMEAEAALRAKQLAQTLSEQGYTPRLLQLAATFELDPFELDILLVCLAPTLDLRYERLYSYLQDDVTRKRPSVNLVLDLLADAGPDRLLRLRHLTDDAPLFKYRLLERESDSPGASLLGQFLRVDETIVAWLLGHYQAHTDLGSYATLSSADAANKSETDCLLARHLSPPLELATANSSQPFVVLYGSDYASQKAAARLLALQFERPLLCVELAPLVKEGLSPLQITRLARRDAMLTNALLCLLQWDVILADNENAPPANVLAELCAHPAPLIIAGKNLWQAKGIKRQRPLLWFETSMPDYAQRLALWRHFLQINALADEQTSNPVSEQTGAPENDHVEENERESKIVNPKSTIDLSLLAGQFLLTTDQIRDVVSTARDRAIQRGNALTGDDLLLAARTHSNPRLAHLARKIVPRYDWADIILPGDQLAILREIIATVRGRPLVLETWGVGRKLASSAGITVLFAGPPGTGKTMAAEIIARELGLDLYKIDLSTIISKYIGETEKNLEKIFAEAQSSNAILFFDEADAIFGKRSEVKDAHDRYANIEVSYLLQRMEAYDGVTILATNLRANLDEAFTRRLQFAVDFPFPERADRLRIWQTLFPPDLPCRADLDFDLLARRFKLAGGNIRNIIVSAAYLAAGDGELVTMDHILHGTRRELQKMGRLVDEADLEIRRRE